MIPRTPDPVHVPQFFRCAVRRLLPAAVWAATSGISVQTMLPPPDDPAQIILASSIPADAWKKDNRSAVSRKLSGIIIPNIEFHATPLKDAIAQLHLESYRRDPDPDPITRGVKIVLRLPPPLPELSGERVPIPGLPESSTPPGEPPRITLASSKTSLLEALRQVSWQAGLRLEIQGDTACLVPMSFPIPALVTTDFRVPPQTLGLSPEVSKPTLADETNIGGFVTIRRLDMKDRLTARGIGFPAGASAVYLPVTRKLVVRNTQENIDLINLLVSPPSTNP